MQLSRFVVSYCNVFPGEHVLYNVLTDHYIGIDDTTREALNAWSSGHQPTGPDERATIELLAAEGFLVPGRAADDRLLKNHLDGASEGIPGTTCVTLQPTLACNLACTYCFQKEFPAFNRMSSGVESSTVDWILRRVDRAGSSRLLLHYFGGEPLTRKDYVLRTAEQLSRGMAERGGVFDWEMTTNGIFLDLPFVLEMKRHGDGAIKVTLDGDRETHDAARVYRDGRGSFDVIFANLAAVAGHVRLRVGGNFLPGQAASYERLLARLDAAGITPHLDSVRFKPVVDTSSNTSGSCTGCSHAKAGTDTLIQIGQSVGQRGFAVEPGIGPCELHWKNNFTIDPDGYVYKCPAVAGRQEMAVTATWKDSPHTEAPLVASRPWEQCGDCPWMPICTGGCLASEYLRTGRTGGVHCTKEAFEASFAESVPRRYREEMEREAWISVQ